MGDAKTQIQGKLDQASGAAQDLYGQADDAARETATGFEPVVCASAAARSQPVTPPIFITSGIMKSDANASMALSKRPYRRASRLHSKSR